MTAAAAAAAKCGSIKLIIGPMFSEKTTELLAGIRRHARAGRRCAIIKYAEDTRYGTGADTIATHDGARVSSSLSVPVTAATRLLEAKVPDDIDVIGVDEGQFFFDVVEACEAWANKGIQVIVAALNGSFDRKPIGNVLQLIPKCEEIRKLHSVCALCGADASFSSRKYVGDGKEKQVGNAQYRPTCRTCHAATLPQAYEEAAPKGASA